MDFEHLPRQRQIISLFSQHKSNIGFNSLPIFSLNGVAESACSIIEFWTPVDQDAKHIRPDVIIKNHPKGKLAIDTKWKMIEDEYPSDDDLKQMFAYAHYVESNHVILLYTAKEKNKHEGYFKHGEIEN